MSISGLSTSLLTTSDYLNKSVEFIPIVLLVSYLLLVTDTLLRKIVSEKKAKNILKWSYKATVLWFALTFFHSILLSPSALFKPIFVHALIVTLIMFTLKKAIQNTKNIVSYKFPPILPKTVFLCLIVLVFTGTFTGYHSSYSIYSHSSTDRDHVIDIFQAGYLKKDGSKIVLENQSGSIIFEDPITDEDRKTPACIYAEKFLKARYFCFHQTYALPIL